MDEQEKKKRALQITERLPAPEEIREDWGRMIVETVMGEGVWDRPGLSRRDRSIATIAALCALYRPHELRLHIENGLRNGLTRAEISEIVMHMAIYGGFPIAVEGMGIAREVFDAQDGEKS